MRRDWLSRIWRRPTPTPKDTTMASMKTNQKIPLSIKATGVNGGDTTFEFEGRASWSAPDGIVQLQPSQNALACEAIALGVVGISVVSVTGTDSRGVVFAADITVEVTAVPEATDHIEIVAGDPIDQ